MSTMAEQTQSPPKHHKSDGNAGFLRAARDGNLEEVLEYLKGSTDINTSNPNGLNALHLASKEGHLSIMVELLNRGANVEAATKKGNTALHIASLAGHEDIVKKLVESGAQVNLQAQAGFTPLYMASQEGHSEVVKFLLASGANQGLSTEDGFTPLAVALQQGHDKVVSVLLEHDAKGKVRLPALHIAAKKDDVKSAALLLQNEQNSVELQTKSGFTPLHIAAHYGNTNVATLLIQRNADVNFKAKNNITPLHVCSRWGKLNMVNLLLDNNATIDEKTRDGLTPLHCASRSGHESVVDTLLERGAPHSAKTKNGLTPLHMSAQGDHEDCARLLLYHKASLNEVTVDYLTPLHVAAHCGNVKTAKLLLDRKCEPNARALNGFTPLHIACKKNRIKVVELLLKYGASIESKTESGLTPLHVASFMGHMNIVIYLIQHNANPNTATVRGETSLHLAARANQSDIIRILLRNGATVDARAREQQTPLHIAARLGNVDNVVLLLQHGAAVDAATKDKYTPLHIAAKEGHDEVAQILLEHEAQHDMTTKKGFTPLHIAAKYGNIKVARLLLQKDANPNAQGKNGLTPLHVASHYNHANVAQLLLENKADPHATAKNGYTPLHIAAKKNQMDIATMLLEYGAKPNAESKNGFTPLHLASQEGHTDIVSLLLEKDANVNSQAQNGLTPIHLAAQEDRVPVAEILCKYGSDTDTHTKAGYTPLHTACHFGQVNMVRFLLDHQASVNATTKVGYTPLHQAAQQGHVQVVSTLLKNQASPNAITNNGQTPLAIAQKLGYISVVEILKPVTEVQVITPSSEDKYKVVSPETMQETFISDSEDEGVDDLLPQSPIFGKPISEQHVYLPYYEGQKMHNRKSAGEDSISLERGGSASPLDTSFDKDYMDAQITSQSFHAVYSAAPTTTGRLPVGTEANRFSSYSGSSFSTSFDPDNVPVDRSPVYSGFLISFMVDARGGAMRGCRHPGVRVIIPPRKCCMPTRVTCRLVTKEKLSKPPALLEGEGLAARILEMGPVGTKFLGPVLLEVPHFASLRGKEREVVILRSDNGETWYEHPTQATEDAVAEALGSNAEGGLDGSQASVSSLWKLDSEEDLSKKRIKRILTSDLPMFFALVSRVTRVKQESTVIGMEGGVLSSNVVPQVQAVLPEGTLTRPIPVGLQAQPIAPELVAKLLGNRVAVSPIVTIEPRRRKFHKPITLTIPVPRAAQKGMINQYGGERPTLRLLFSLAADPNPAVWEDVTDTKPMTLVDDCVSFTTTVSARFWLIDCQNVAEAAQMASILYQEAVTVPYMAKFVVFAKRDSPEEGKLRIFCMTDDKDDKTLEKQEKFYEVARSRDIEVLEGRPQFVEMAGNLIPVTKSGDQLHVNFRAFRENRLPCTVKIRDQDQEASARVAFMKEPKVARGEAPQTPICNLNIRLPDMVLSDSGELDTDRAVEVRSRHDLLRGQKLVIQDPVNQAEMKLSDVADTVQGDWVVLAQQLQVSISDINHMKNDYKTVSDQALAMLHFWVQKNGDKATGIQLENALRRINRDDVVRKCLHSVDRVDDEVEAAAERAAMDQSGFDTFKEEVGITKDSLKRGMSLDVQYDEQDIIKNLGEIQESESAAEESPTGIRGHPQYELREDAPWERKDSDRSVPSVDEEDIVKSSKTSTDEALPSATARFSSEYHEQREQVPDRPHVTFSDQPYSVEPDDKYEDYGEEEVLTPPPSPTEKLDTEEPVLATESSIAEAATRLASSADDYSHSEDRDGSYHHGQPRTEREVMYSRAEIVSPEVAISFQGTHHVASESSSQVLSPLSDAGSSYNDEPSPVPEPQLPEDFKADELDYDRVEDEGDELDTLHGTIKCGNAGYESNVFQYQLGSPDDIPSQAAYKTAENNKNQFRSSDEDSERYKDHLVHDDQYLQEHPLGNEQSYSDNTQHSEDGHGFGGDQGYEVKYSEDSHKESQDYQGSNGHPQDEWTVQTEHRDFQVPSVTSIQASGSIVEELSTDQYAGDVMDSSTPANRGLTYEDKLQDKDRFEVQEQDMREKYSEFVREQLALSQTSELPAEEREIVEQTEIHRELYTANIYEDTFEPVEVEEVEVIDFSETREAAIVKEEQETYEVPHQTAVVIPFEKEMVLDVDEIAEEISFEAAEEDKMQEHDMVSVVTKVDEVIEPDHLDEEEYVEEFVADTVEDVAFKDFTASEFVTAHEIETVETEEPKHILMVESVSHSLLEETINVVEEESSDERQEEAVNIVEEEETEERQEEAQEPGFVLEEQETVYGDESPITDLKYTSLADPVTIELVREKIETIEEVVSKLEKKFEMTSSETYDSTLTSESHERITSSETYDSTLTTESRERTFSDKMTYEETERVKEEFRSEFTEDVSETTQDFSEIRSELVESLESQHELDTSKEQVTEVSEVEEIITTLASAQLEKEGVQTVDHTQDIQYFNDTKATGEPYFAEESELTQSIDKTLDGQTEEEEIIMAHTLTDGARDIEIPAEDTEFVNVKRHEPAVESYQISVHETIQSSWNAREEFQEAGFDDLETRVSQQQTYAESVYGTAHIISTEIEGEEDEEIDHTESEDITASLEKIEVDMYGDELKIDSSAAVDIAEDREEVVIRTEAMSELKSLGDDDEDVGPYEGVSSGGKLLDVGPYDEELESVAATAGSDVAGVEEVEQECCFEMKENDEKELAVDDQERLEGEMEFQYVEEKLGIKDEYVKERGGFEDEEQERKQEKDMRYIEEEERELKEEEIGDQYEEITEEAQEVEFQREEQYIYEKEEEQEDKFEDERKEEYGDRSEEEGEEYEKEKEKKIEYQIYQDERELSETVEDSVSEIKVSGIEAKAVSLPEEEADEIEETVEKSKVKITFTQFSDDYDEEEDQEHVVSKELQEQESEPETVDQVDAARYDEESIEATEFRETHRSFATLPDEEEDEIQDITIEEHTARKAQVTKSEPVLEKDSWDGYVDESNLGSDQFVSQKTAHMTSEEEVRAVYVRENTLSEDAREQGGASIEITERRIQKQFSQEEDKIEDEEDTRENEEEVDEAEEGKPAREISGVWSSSEGLEQQYTSERIQTQKFRAEVDTEDGGEDWVLLDKSELTEEEIVLAATLKMAGKIRSTEDALEHEEQRSYEASSESDQEEAGTRDHEKEVEDLDRLASDIAKPSVEKKWEEEISDEDLVEKPVSPVLVEEVVQAVPVAEASPESKVASHHRVLIETQMGSIEIEEMEEGESVEDMNIMTSFGVEEQDEIEEGTSAHLVHEVTVETVGGVAEEKEISPTARSDVSDLSPLQEDNAVILEATAYNADYEVTTAVAHTVSEQLRIAEEVYEVEEETVELQEDGAKEELTVFPITPLSETGDMPPSAGFSVAVSSQRMEEKTDRMLALQDEESESVSVSEKAIGSSPEEQENLDDENVLDQDEEFAKEAEEEYVKEEYVKDIDEELDQEIEEQEQLTAALLSQYSKDSDSEEEEAEEEEEEYDEEEEKLHKDYRGMDLEQSETFVDKEDAGIESMDKIKQQVCVVAETSLELITEQSPESDTLKPYVGESHKVGLETKYATREEEEDVDKAFQMYEAEPEVIVPIDAEVGEHAEIVLEDIDRAFEKYEHEPEVSVPIDAKVEYLFTEEQETCEEASEVHEVSTETVWQAQEMSVQDNVDMSMAMERGIEHEEEWGEDRLIGDKLKKYGDNNFQSGLTGLDRYDVGDADQSHDEDVDEDVKVEEEDQTGEEEKKPEELISDQSLLFKEELEEVTDVKYEVELSKVIVQEALHTSIEATRKTEFAEGDAEPSTGILAEMQALEYQQAQEDVISEDDLDDDQYGDEQERSPISYGDEPYRESGTDDRGSVTRTEIKTEFAEHTTRSEVFETRDDRAEVSELEQSIDRMEEKLEKLGSTILETCSLEKMDQSVDRIEVKLEQTVDVLDIEFVADGMESSVDRIETFVDVEQPLHFEGAADVYDTDNADAEEIFTKEKPINKDEFIEDVNVQMEASYTDTNLQEEIAEIPESFIDRSERFLELLQDIIRPDEDDKDRLTTFQTDFGVPGGAQPERFPHTESELSPHSQQPRDDYGHDQGPIDGLSLGLHLSGSQLYPTTSMEVHECSRSDVDKEILETEIKFTEVTQMPDFDEESPEEEFLDPEASSQPQEVTVPTRSGQETAGQTFMASSISGSDYTSQSDVEYAQSETTGTGSYYTAPSEIMSSSSYTAQSETMTGSEYTMTGSEYGHDADEEEYESEGRLSADVSKQIFIEHKLSRKCEDKQEISSSDDEFDDGMDRLDRPPSPSEFTLIESQDTERLNISLGITPPAVARVIGHEAAITQAMRSVEQTQQDTLCVQYDTDIEKDSLQDEEEEHEDYDEEEDDDEHREEDGERMIVDLAVSDRPPSPSDFTLIASQDQESLQRVLNIEEALSPEQETGSPMQWEHDLEKAIIDADAMSTASSDAALMIGLDRISVTGTDNNTMSGVSSESGQQEQFCGESPLDDDIEDRQQLYRAYMKEMENERMTEEELKERVLTLSQSEDFSAEPCDDGSRKGNEEFEDIKTEEFTQPGENIAYDMYEDYVESQRSLQEKEDSKETLSLEVGYCSPPAHFDDMSQEEIQESLVSVTELEERLRLPAQEEGSMSQLDDETDNQSAEDGLEEKYREGYSRVEISEDSEEKVHITQLEDEARVELTQESLVSSSTEFETDHQFGRAWLSEHQEERFSAQASYSYTYEDKLEVKSSEETFRQSTCRDNVQTSSEYKASSFSTQSETKSELDSHLEPGDNLFHHSLEAVEKRVEEDRHDLAAMALHTVDKMSSSSSEVAQLDDFDDQDVEIREVSEETSEETDVEDQFSPVLAQTAGPAFVFEEVSPLGLSHEKDKQTQQSDLTPVDMEGHEEKLLRFHEVGTERMEDSHDVKEATLVESINKRILDVSTEGVEYETQDAEVRTDDKAVKKHLDTLDIIDVIGDIGVDDHAGAAEELDVEEEIEDIDDTEFEPELCGLSHSDDHEIEGEEEETTELEMESEDIVELREDEGEHREGEACMAYDNMAFRDEEEEAFLVKRELLRQETRDISPEDLEEKPVTFDFPDDFKEEMTFQIHYDRTYTETIESYDLEHEEDVSEKVVTETDMMYKEESLAEVAGEDEEEYRMEPSDDIGAQEVGHSISDMAHIETVEESEVMAEGEDSGEDDESDEVSSKSSSDSGGVEVFDEQTGQYTRLPWEIAHQYKRQFSESFVEEQKSSVKPQKSIDMGTFYRRDKTKDDEYLEKSFYDDSEPVSSESVAKRRVTFGFEQEEFVSTVDEEEMESFSGSAERSRPCEPYERIDDTHDADVLVTIMESRQYVRSEIAKQVYDPEFPETPKQDMEFNMAASPRPVTSVFDESEEDAMFSYQRVSEERYHFSEQRSEMMSVVSKESRMAQQELLLQESLDEEDRSLSPSRESSSKMLSTTFEEILPQPPPAHPTHFPMAVHSVGKSLADNEIYESSETERDSTEEKLSPIEETPGMDEFEEDDRTLKSTPPVEKKVTFQTDRLTTRASEQSVDDFKASSSSSELSVEPTLLAASYDLDSGSVCHVVTAYDISPDTVEKQGPIEIAGKSILSSPEDDVFETDALTPHKTSELSPEGPVIPRGHLLYGKDVCPSPPMPIAPVSTPREGSEREDLSSSLQSASTILERLTHDERMDSKDGEDTLQEDDMSSPHEEVALNELKSEEGSPDAEFAVDVRFSEINFSGEAMENGFGPHAEDSDKFEEHGISSAEAHHVTDRSEVHVLNGPTEVDYIPEYDGGDERVITMGATFRDVEEEDDSQSEPSFSQPDLIDSDMASSLEAKPDVQQPEEEQDVLEGEVEPIQPTIAVASQAKPDIQQPTKDDDDDGDDHPDKEKHIKPSFVSLVQAKPDIQQPTKDDDEDDDHSDGGKRIQPTFVSLVQAKPDIQQPTKDDDEDDDHPDGGKRIQPTFVSLVQAKPDIQQPEDNGSPPEVEDPIQTVVTTSSQAKPDIQQVKGEADEPDGEDLIQPSIMNTSGAKPDIQQPDDDKDTGYPIVEVPIQPTVTTSGQLRHEEHPKASTVYMVGSEPSLALTEVEKEGIHSSSVVEDEEFSRHVEQEIFIGTYSPEREEGEELDGRMFSSTDEVYHGKRALDSLEDTTFSEVYEERDDAVPEGYAMSGEPLLQDEPALQEGDEDLELEEEEEEYEERPEEELIRLEEPPAESDEEECADTGTEKNREESYSVISTGLSSADLLRVSSGSQSDLDRPLSPTPDALRQGFFGGNFTPPQSGMFTPPITGSFTPPQTSQETSVEDSSGLEKAAVTLVDSVFEDVKVSCQAAKSEDATEGESRKGFESEMDKPTVFEQTVEEVLTEDDEYGQPDMSSEIVRRSGFTLVKQISEDIPGIILTQHLHEEINEDEYYGYSPQPESISEDEEDRYLKEMAEMSQLKKEEMEEITSEIRLAQERGGDMGDTVKCVVLEASRTPIVEGFVTDDTPLTPSAPEAESPQKEHSFLGDSDPGSGFVFTEPAHSFFHDEQLFVSADLESGSDLFDEIVEPMLSPEDHGDSSSVDSFATVVAAEADEAEYEADENRLAEIASMTSSFTSDIQVSFPEENRRDMAEDLVDTEDDDMSLERSQEWLSTTPDDKDRESDNSNDSDKFEFVDRAALSIITEMSDEDKFEMIEGEDLESETGLSDNLGSSPDTNIQQSPGISNLRFFGRGAERDDTASISSSLAEFEKLEKAIPISSSLSSIERDADRDSFGGSYDERKFVGFQKLKEGEESASIASSLAEFEHLEQVLVVSSSGSSVEKQTPESKSSGGSGENTSNSISSSLADFERIEHECQVDSDEKKSSVESSSRPSEASSCASLNEFERFEREIAVAAQLEEEAQKIVSILESGVLMECARFGSSEFSEAGGGDEKDSLEVEGLEEIDHDSLSEGARLGHDEDADSLDGESSEVTEMASSVVFTGPDLAVSQAVAADLDTDSLQGEALMQLSSDSLILEQKLKSSDSTKFDTDSLFGQDDRMVQSGDSLEFGGQSSGGQSSGGQSSEKQEDKNIPGEDTMQTSVDSLELDNSKEEAKESVEKDQQQDDSLMMVSVESAAWSMGSSGGTGHSMSESHTDSSHSHDIMQVSTESDNIKSGAGPEKTIHRSEQILASETAVSKESREYHHLEQHQQWHRAETTVQHVTSSTTRQHQSSGESKTKPKRESPKFSEYEEPQQEDSLYLAKGPYQEVKKVYTMAEWEAMKQAKKEDQQREAKSSALSSSSPDLSENSDRDEKQSPPSQTQIEPLSSQKTSMISYSTTTTTTSYSRGGRDRDLAHTSDEDDVPEGAASQGYSDFGDDDVQTHRVIMKKEVHKRTLLGADGEEETTIREDSQIQQDNEPPEELQESMQEIIRQFMESEPQPAHRPAERESLEDDV